MDEKIKTDQDVRLVSSCTKCGAQVCQCDNGYRADLDPPQIDPREVDPLIGAFVHEHFEIIELIGVGGMGAVYKARHRIIDKLVAVKVLSSMQLTDSKANLRFQQEAKAASALNHPNLISVLDFGLLPNDQPFIIMDFVDGASLADVIDRRGALEPERAKKIFVQIADALSHAHQRGIVHRDLKPSNIMLVTADDGSDFVKVVDFGIAKIEKTEQSLTETGEVFGSPLYMSPEQCAGRSIDFRSDLYSFGCVMYETLSGLPPFYCANALQTIFAHLNEEAPSILSIKPAVPIELQNVVQRCMEKSPDERYQSADSIRADLLTAVAPRANAPIHNEKFTGINEFIFPGLLFLITSVLCAVLLMPNLLKSNDSKQVPFASSSSPPVAESIPKREIDSSQEPPRNYKAQVEALVNAGKFGEAESILRKQVDFLRIKQLDKTPEFGECLFGLGGVIEGEGRNQEALTYRQQALRVFQSLKDLPWIVTVCNAIGNSCGVSRDYQLAADYHKKAYDLLKDSNPQLFDKESLLVTACAYASDLEHLDRDPKLIENLFNEGISSGETRGADSGWLIIRIFPLAQFYTKQKRFDEACRLIIAKAPTFCDAYNMKNDYTAPYIYDFISAASNLPSADQVKLSQQLITALEKGGLKTSKANADLATFKARALEHK